MIKGIIDLAIIIIGILVSGIGLSITIIGMLVFSVGPIIIMIIYGSPVWLFLYLISWLPGLFLIVVGYAIIDS